MRRIFKWMLTFVLITFTSLVLGWKVWFDLWMYHGWPGPPGILAKWLSADGERAYDAIMDEMSIICFIVLSAVWIAVWMMIKRTRSTTPPPGTFSP